MKVSTFLQKLSPLRIEGPPEAEISGLFYDSRSVFPGGAFFALRGAAVDGHRFIGDAVARGARVVVLEETHPVPQDVTMVLVENSRRAMALFAQEFFGDPTRGIPVVGVTGTNGKTTVTYLVESILKVAGMHPAVLGTVNYRFGERQLPAMHTTPESVDLLRTLAEFRAQGADALVMEASSHALEQQRTAGVRFEVGVFTNLTPEHLDYHGEMEAYFASKRKLFEKLEAGTAGKAVINIDDPYGARLAGELDHPLTCGTVAGAQIRARDVRMSLEGIEASVETPRGSFQLRSPLVGLYNLQNLLCAAGAGLALGIALDQVAQGLCRASQVPGRLERIANQVGALVLVDYAHTRDALENVLVTLRELSPRRLITVFGCGGDRDRTKRPAMGEVAARLSDLVVVTSDNPRNEDPLAIIEEIRGGVQRVIPAECSRQETFTPEGKKYLVVADRRSAIELAVEVLQAGDLLVVAGKGHEDYQILGRERIHFDDREELRRALALREAEASP
ncbi:UDP-N-acetylmuramoyl-L-alanyl-D-glutamate--2,6-diaminopimelate ligase [Desulfuromonas versatilis]|nr:UDP-N-acetylmuramoyl-L-alanyl-D-glutamate--2,6-diaminopimelate ligase [Desulfuromonas versatilis]